MTQYIIIYRQHNQLNNVTQYYGAFDSYQEAYDYLCTLPPLTLPHGETMLKTGVKYIQELTHLPFIRS